MIKRMKARIDMVILNLTELKLVQIIKIVSRKINLVLDDGFNIIGDLERTSDSFGGRISPSLAYKKCFPFFYCIYMKARK